MSVTTQPQPRLAEGVELQQRLIGFIRAFGLHQPDATPCGEPIPVSEAHALGELAAQDSLGQLELTRRLRLQKSTVSRLLDQLERRGWVQRRRDPADGRAVRLALTPAGRAAASHLEQARQAKLGALLAAIPAHERGGVLHALDVLIGALRD